MSKRSDDSTRMQEGLGEWRDIDRRLNLGELSVEEALEELYRRGLIRKVNTFANRVRVDAFITPANLHFLEPARRRLIPGPVLLLDWGNLYGGRRFYFPLSGELRWDTGAYSVGPWVQPPESEEGGEPR